MVRVRVRCRVGFGLNHRTIALFKSPCSDAAPRQKRVQALWLVLTCGCNQTQLLTSAIYCGNASLCWPTVRLSFPDVFCLSSSSCQTPRHNSLLMPLQNKG